jgi:hypothetical protein
VSSHEPGRTSDTTTIEAPEEPDDESDKDDYEMAKAEYEANFEVWKE